MDKIKIAVSGRVATVVNMPEVVADNAEYAVSFAVDPQDGWDMASPITALFVRRDSKYSAVVMAAGETECVMPPARGTTMVFAGLTQDETRTTTPAQIPVRRSVRNLTDFPPLPDKDVYAQILAAFAGVKTISGKGAPTTGTKGVVNQIYRDETTQKLYVCTAAEDGVYTWAAVTGSGGGGSVDVDATLTKAGEAADAKAVGDALAKKADADVVAVALSGKADAGAVTTALAGKASKSEIPSVPSWAMADTKPTYTAAEVGALPSTTVIPDVSGKVDKQQGTANAGKILGIGDDGVVVPTARPTFTLTESDKAEIAGEVVADGVEVTEKDIPVQALAGATAPTTSTVGVVGQEYYVIVDNAVAEMYVCTSALIGSYTWDKVEFGGGSYTLPTASSTTLGGVKPIAKTDAMTQGVGVDNTGALWTAPYIEGYELVFTETVAEDVGSYTRTTDKDGNTFDLTDVLVIIFTKPFAESTNSGGRAVGFLPGTMWGSNSVIHIQNALAADASKVGYYDVVYAKVVDGYQICDRYYISQNSTTVFGTMKENVSPNATGISFHSDATKLMQINRPQGNFTCLKIVGYLQPLVSAGTIISLYKRKGT